MLTTKSILNQYLDYIRHSVSIVGNTPLKGHPLALRDDDWKLMTPSCAESTRESISLPTTCNSSQIPIAPNVKCTITH
jgi:hypothetical protein